MNAPLAIEKDVVAEGSEPLVVEYVAAGEEWDTNGKGLLTVGRAALAAAEDGGIESVDAAEKSVLTSA